MLEWLSKHKFQAHLAAFLLMVISSIGMILALQSEAIGFIWIMIAIFTLASILAIFIK